MSVSPIPLADVVRRLASRVSYRAAGIIGLALSRVTSDDAHAQYVPAGQPEAYQLKSEQQLAVDVCEELADAVAYLAPLAEKNALYAEAVEHIALAHQIVTLTAWRDA